jgi:hypothetical protein
VVQFLSWSVAGSAVGSVVVLCWVHVAAGQMVRRKAESAARYCCLGAWVVSHRSVQGDPAGLLVSQSAWAASCLVIPEEFRKGCRQVSPPAQPIVQGCAGCPVGLQVSEYA